MALGDFMNQAMTQQLGQMSSFYQDKDKERSRQSDDLEKLKIQQEHQTQLQKLQHQQELERAEHAQKLKEQAIEDELERQKRQKLSPEQEEYQRGQLGLPPRPDRVDVPPLDAGEYQPLLDRPLSLGEGMRTRGLGGGGAYNMSNPYMTGGVMPGEGQGLMGRMRGSEPPDFAYRPTGPSLMGGAELQRPQPMPQTIPSPPMTMYDVNRYKAMQTRRETPEERLMREIERQRTADAAKSLEKEKGREFQKDVIEPGKTRRTQITAGSATERNRESIKSKEKIADANIQAKYDLARERISAMGESAKKTELELKHKAIKTEMDNLTKQVSAGQMAIPKVEYPEAEARLVVLSGELDKLKAEADKYGRSSSKSKVTREGPAFLDQSSEKMSKMKSGSPLTNDYFGQPGVK